MDGVYLVSVPEPNEIHRERAGGVTPGRSTSRGSHPPTRLFCSSPLDDALEWLELGDLQRSAEVVADLRARVDAEPLVHGGEQFADFCLVVLDVGAVFGG